MKTKLISIVMLTVSTLAVFFFPGPAPAVILAIFFLYLALGVLNSSRRGLDPLNEVPNAFRLLLAGLAPLLTVAVPQPFGFSSGLASFAAALLLNDEYQRRTVDSIRKGRVGGTVALLGIDGSGKSTHAEALEAWFKARGYYCSRVPFHRYLFVERLARGRRSGRNGSSRSGGNPLRPLLSAADNILLYVITAFGRGLEGRVVLYDRYVWSTYVKYAALGYPVRPLRWLYMLPMPKCAIVLDVPVEKSLEVIRDRPDHIRYQRDVLGIEHDEYVRISERQGAQLVDASKDRNLVQQEIESLLSTVFPACGK